MTEHLLLIDSSGFAYRAYFAFPPSMRKSDSMPTHAILGFLGMAFKMLKRAEADPVTYGAAVFDAPGRTFRHRLYPEYKAGRERPEGLAVQLPLLREAARVLGLEPVELIGFEADDLIATLATRAKAAGIRTTVVSVDKDLYQLVEDDVIEIVDPVQRARVLEKDVVAKFGVAPHLVPDVQALCGDAVDGIPGISGIGLKTAAGLIRRFGTLDGLMADIAKGYGFASTPSIRAALRKERKNIPLYRKLVTLRRDVPIKIEFEALRPKAASEAHLREMLRALDAEDRMDALFGLGGVLAPPRALTRLPKPLEWWQEELKAPGQTVPPIPQCGFYQRRLVRGGPWVPARIWREPELDFVTEKPTGLDVILCEVAGKRVSAWDAWGYLSNHPIKESEFKHMTAVGKWAKDHAPQEPEANPTQSIDLYKVKPPVFTKPKRRTP